MGVKPEEERKSLSKEINTGRSFNFRPYSEFVLCAIALGSLVVIAPMLLPLKLESAKSMVTYNP